MQNIILKYTLQNSVKYNGKPNLGAVLGKILQEKPNLKSKINELKKEIEIQIKLISKLNLQEQITKLQELAPKLLQKKKEKKGLKKLPKAKIGKVITRLPPEPSKYLHIGHALSFLINYLYAKKYNGKCILRYEDANPEKCKKEYVDAIQEDILEYLKIKPNKTIYVSDNIKKLYLYAEKLIKKDKAYVCFCKKENISKLRRKKENCKCREKNNNLEKWKNMLKGKYKEGACCLRLKINMKSKNTAMRDPVIFRLNNKKHFRHAKKYKVWPTFDFYNSLEDSFCNITHVMRSIEFGNVRIELQNYIRRLFNLKNPVIIQYGRFNLLGRISQGREIRKLIEDKKVKSWDDPRLTTLKALRKRGFVKETFYELAKEVGLSLAETNIDSNKLAAINTKFIDKKANRYFIILNPRKIKIKNAPELRVDLDLYPNLRKKGRKFLTKQDFYLQDKLEKNKNYRLMHLFNFRSKEFISEELDPRLNSKFIHWLPVSKDLVKVEVLMDNNKIIKGLGESGLKKIKVGEIIQAERNFFCKLIKKEKHKLNFIFLHR